MVAVSFSCLGATITKLTAVPVMSNGNRDYFQQNPDKVAELGLTTPSINGALECNGGHTAPVKRYQIFEALAKRVGLTGFLSAGCH